MNNDIIKILIVKTNKGCFVSDCMTASGYDYNYRRTKIENLLFDGEFAIETHLKNWYYISDYPDKIQRKCSGKSTNMRYVIKDEKYVSAAMPKIILYENKEKYEESVIEFYKFESDKEPDYLEDVAVDLETIMEVDNFEFAPTINYNAIYRLNFTDTPYTIKNVDVHHQLIDKMIFPEVMLHSRPASFTSQQVYNITRQYIIEHINLKVAKITSNYDFCFTVKKQVPKNEPEKITYNNIFGRTKKEREKLHTTIKEYTEYTIFEMTSQESHYQGYTIISSMSANSESELKKKMDDWLCSLIQKINEPICECPNCKGAGYLINQTKIQLDKEFLN